MKYFLFGFLRATHRFVNYLNQTNFLLWFSLTKYIKQNYLCPLHINESLLLIFQESPVLEREITKTTFLVSHQNHGPKTCCKNRLQLSVM
jgi:hypothetical protein